MTPFIGREEEIEQLHARLADPAYRLLSIVGPGGIGKSRLAQQVAAQHLNTFRDGVYFISLVQVQAVESIPAAIAETLGLAFAASQKSQADQLIEMISTKQLLLVLDNFEHLMDGIDLLVALLQQSPNLIVLLVTSHEPLNLQAEDLFELQGLPVPANERGCVCPTFRRGAPLCGSSAPPGQALQTNRRATTGCRAHLPTGRGFSPGHRTGRDLDPAT